MKDSNMQYKKSWFFLLPMMVLVICFTAFCHNGPQPQTREGVLLKGIYEILNGYHFSPKQVDNTFSETAFNEFFKNLDAGKRFFTQEDIQALSVHRTELDDQFKNGDISFFDQAIARFDAGILKAESYYKEAVDQAFNFDKSGSIILDEDKTQYAKNDKELKEVWNKSMRYEFLNRYYDDIKNLEKEKKTRPKDSIELDIRKEVKENFEAWFRRLKDLKRDERFEIYLNTLTHLYDPHTDYLSPRDKEDFNITMSGKLEGIGARLQTDREYTKVANIVPGGPAWKQKELEANDIILSVQQKNADPVDIKGMRIDEVVKIVRGKKGTQVTLKVKKPSGIVKEITITRDEVIMDEGFARSALLDMNEAQQKVGYIKLPRFYADFDNPSGPSAAKDIAKELNKLKAEGATSLILDLRNNGGGSLQEVVEMAGLFIEQGPIVQVKSRGNVSPYTDPDPDVQFDGPMVILVNSNSASASEIIAACLQDYKRAVIVGGEPTFGKGSVQRFVNLDRTVSTKTIDVASGGDIKSTPLGELKITIQKYYRINGGSVQLKGVEPDVLLPDHYAYIENGEKEYDHPLPYDVIQQQSFTQNVYNIANLDEVKQKSKERIQNNANFALIDENAKRLRSLRDQDEYPLEYKAYDEFIKSRNDAAKKFENLGKDPIAGLSAKNLDADKEYINLDSSRVGRNEDFLKGISKDLQIAESILILRDLKKN